MMITAPDRPVTVTLVYDMAASPYRPAHLSGEHGAACATPLAAPASHDGDLTEVDCGRCLRLLPPAR